MDISACFWAGSPRHKNRPHPFGRGLPPPDNDTVYSGHRASPDQVGFAPPHGRTRLYGGNIMPGQRHVDRNPLERSRALPILGIRPNILIFPHGAGPKWTGAFLMGTTKAPKHEAKGPFLRAGRADQRRELSLVGGQITRVWVATTLPKTNGTSGVRSARAGARPASGTRYLKADICGTAAKQKAPGAHSQGQGPHQ